MTSRKPPNKGSTWVVSSFGDFGLSSTSADKKGGKRTRDTTGRGDARKKKQQQSSQQLEGRSALWVDLYSPTTRDDLAVHKKKVQEVESWLVENAAGMKGRKLLLLTGPSGCGKSAAVRVLAREGGLNLMEWTNPTTTPYNDNFMEQDQKSTWRPGDAMPVSQTTQFWEFLMRCSKYNSVCGTTGKGGNLVCVEDFPNAILRDPSSFHSMLRKYSQWERSSPLVFIVTDSTNRYGNVKQLFPPDLLNQLSIINIVFNPIANSLMLKALTRILNIESAGESVRQQTIPSKEVLQSLVEASGGDVRSAVNALQFATRKDAGSMDGLFTSKKDKSSSTSSKGRKNSSSSSSTKSKHATNEEDNIAVGGKDASLFLFRALGKVLYCKRFTDRGITEPLPEHLKKHERLPLQEVPETIYEKTSMGASSFSLFLHQNYLSFFPDIEAVTKAAHYLSDSDVLMAEWMERDVLEGYASSVTSRGLMYANQHGTSGGGWRPLTRPQWYTVTRETQQHSLVLKDEYSKHTLTTEELMTVLVPLKCKIINASSRTTHEVGRISSIRKINYSERLGELDISSAVTESEEGEGASTSSSQSKPTTITATPSVSISSVVEEEYDAEDEELFIEDPDD